MKWLDKYMPRTWDAFDNHLAVKAQMESWLQAVRARTPGRTHVLYLCGPAGSGKTTMNRLLLEKYRYDIIEWNAIDLKYAKTMEEVLGKVLYKQNIQVLVQEAPMVTGVMLEECDCLQNMGKEALSRVTEGLADIECDAVPIVCTSNEDMCEPIRNVTVIYVAPLTHADVMRTVRRVCDGEMWTLSEEALKALQAFMDTDLRAWLMQLESMYAFFGPRRNNITAAMVATYFQTTQQKNANMTLYQMSERVFDAHTHGKHLQLYADTDSVIFPMMIYSNTEMEARTVQQFLQNKIDYTGHYFVQEVFREHEKKVNTDTDVSNGYCLMYSAYYAVLSTHTFVRARRVKQTANEIAFPSNIYNKKYTECTHRKHLNQMITDYDVSRTMLDYWSYALYWLYQHATDAHIVERVCAYRSLFPSTLNNEHLNEIFKCDYLREELKKRKKENVLKVLYQILDVDVKKDMVKKKRGRPKKNPF